MSNLEKNIDIDEELNKIIFKYNLDRYYPHYRNKYEAEKILHNIVKEIIQYNRKALFVGDDDTGIEFIRNMTRDYADIHFCLYERYDKMFQKLTVIIWDEYEKVYLISFYGSEPVERWFRQNDIQYEWIYDIFERGGLFLQREFFAFGKEDLFSLIVLNSPHNPRDGFTESILCELYCQQSKYDNTDDCCTKRIALERCLFLTLYMRNFVASKRYISLLSNEDKRYERIWDEIQNLLNSIRDILRNRKQKDIMLYWIDSVPYGDEKDMAYLQSVMQDSIVFENAFTDISNTHPALRTMFLGKRDMDDQTYNISKITRENSPLIQFLEAHGYGIKAFTGYFANSFPTQYLSNRFYMDFFDTASMKLWDVLSGMVSGERKTLWVVHIMETHVYYLNSRMSDNNLVNSLDNVNERYRLSMLEVDEQLAFYDTFMNEDTFRIYMSDHGRNEGAIHTNNQIKFHILFNIYNKTLKPRRIDGMFSLLDFSTVLKQIVVDGSIDEKKFLREYAEISCFDRYNEVSVMKLLKNKLELPLSWIGFKGIVDKEYIYVHYKTGKEWLQKRDNLPSMNPWLFYDNPNDICEPVLLEKYRKLAGEYPEEIYKDDKFKYAKYMYRVYNNILSHNDLPERIGIINSMLLEYPENSVAIRMGGQHSLVLWHILSNENRKKIWGFIDNSDECPCRAFCLPIVHANQIEKLGNDNIKAVLLSSFVNIDMLRAESDMYSTDIDVLDIYNCFEKNGIQCHDNFWLVKCRDEDFDVGFPFEEVE